MELQALLEKVKYFEERGFEFFQAWTMDEPITPDRILIPSGRIMDLDELAKLENSDSEVKTALEYYSVLRELPIDNRDHYFSFINDLDVNNCRIKYNRAEKNL